MSDALDAVAEALARTNHLAATRLVRKEELEAELAQLQAAGAAPDDPRVQAVQGDLARAADELRGAMAEIAELQKLAGRARQMADRAPVDAALDQPDPIIRSDIERALDNARAGIADRAAQARLDEELAPRAPATPPPDPAAADADALQKFRELVAKKQQPAAPPDAQPTTTPTPKKTF
jgi:hypothetical protein